MVENILSEKEHIRILGIDRDPGSQAALGALIQSMRYNAAIENDVRQAFHELDHQEFSAVITDNMLNGHSGLDILKRAKKDHLYIEVIIVTGHVTLESALTALYQGTHSFIEKPITFSEIEAHIKQALAKRFFALYEVKNNRLDKAVMAP